MTEQVFPQTAAGKIMFEDGIGCQYNNTAVQAKLHQIAAALAPLVNHLDFAAPDCLEVASSRNYQTLASFYTWYTRCRRHAYMQSDLV